MATTRKIAKPTLSIDGGTWTFPRTKMVPFETANGGTGHTSRPNGKAEVDLVVEVDVEKLIRSIGRKALGKSGRTALQGGAVVVRVVRRVDHPE